MCRSFITRATFKAANVELVVVVVLFVLPFLVMLRADYMLAKSVKNGKMMTFVKNIKVQRARCGRVEILTNA